MVPLNWAGYFESEWYGHHSKIRSAGGKKMFRFVDLKVVVSKTGFFVGFISVGLFSVGHFPRMANNQKKTVIQLSIMLTFVGLFFR